MKTSKTTLNNLLKRVAELTDNVTSLTEAKEQGKSGYLYLEYISMYGGYNLLFVDAKNGSHNGVFGFSSCEPRIKAPVMEVQLKGLIAGLSFKRKQKSIFITAKEWFDKVNGNSYFSAIVTIDGDKQIKIPFQYGYGEQYETVAAHQLQLDGVIPAEVTIYSLGRYCRENNIQYKATKHSNCLQRDVKAFVA